MLEKIAFTITRGCLGAIFIVSGWAKLAGIEDFIAYAAFAGLPFPTAAVLGAAVLELVAGVALVSGVRLALAAGTLALFSLLTAVIFHADFGNDNEQIHFLKNVAIAGGLAHIAFREWLSVRHLGSSVLPSPGG